MVKWEQLSASEGGRDNNMELAKNLETPRLVIRSCRKTDTDFILSIWGDRENGKFMTAAASENVDEKYLEAIEGLSDDPDGYNMIIELKESGASVGTCCAYPENGNYDIGYSIAKDHWKEGLGTEMIGALLQWIRAEGGKSVSGEAADDNKAWRCCINSDLRKAGKPGIKKWEKRPGLTPISCSLSWNERNRTDAAKKDAAEKQNAGIRGD